MRTKLLFPLLCATLLTVSCGSAEKETSTEKKAAPQVQPEPKPQGTPHAVFVTDKGKIVVKLLPEVAPKTVEAVIGLVRSGFYVKTKFHRVMPGTMIQGGDPNSKDNDPYNDGQGNAGNVLPAEFSSRKFDRGVVAMARQEAVRDSASSQFFIVLKRMSHWDKQYTVFGEVVEGLDVAERISRAPLSKDPRLKSWPVENIRIRDTSIEYR